MTALMAMPPEPSPAFGNQRPRICTVPPRYSDKTGLECVEFATNVGFDLDPWQGWLLTEALGTKKDGTWAAFEVAEVVGRQNGKNPVDNSTDLLTTRGWATIGSVQVGDWVYGADGRPVRVVAVTETFPSERCCEVSFTDGSRYTASEDHLWWVSYRGRSWRAVRTADLARTLGGRRSLNGRMEYNWRVRCDTVVQTPPAKLPVDPYLLGYWLGDGNAKQAQLYAAKTDLAWVEGIIAAAGGHVRHVRTAPQTGVQEITFDVAELDAHTRRTYGSLFAGLCKDMGIFGPGQKRIPELYLIASPAQRLALLRGLMDSDGSIAITNKAPQVEFASSYPELAEGFHRLVRSLGIRVTPKIGRTSCNGKRCKDRTRFLWTPSFNPFAMPRKAERWRPPVSRRHELMSITGIRPVPSVPTRCIEVDSPDHVFLIGRTFTPTHNCTVEARELFGLFELSEPLIIHTAHEFKASNEHFLRLRDRIKGCPELDKRVRSIITSHGEEAVSLRPVPALIFGPGRKLVRKSVAPRLRFLARSRGSGRSFTCTTLVWDEAMILSADQVGASMPTMSAVPNPQLWYLASAGYPDSTQLAMIRRRGIRGDDPDLAYFEWSIRPHTELCPRDERAGRRSNRFITCTEHDDRDNPQSWAKANPGMGYRISPEHIARELAGMPPDSFDIERLGAGQWPTDDEGWTVVSEDQWNACQTQVLGGTATPVCFAVDVTPDLSAACISVAWQRPSDGLIIVEIPQGGFRPGTSWVVPRLLELRKKWRPLGIAVPKSAPASALINDATSRGLDLLQVSPAEEAQGFTQFITAVRDKAIGHLGPDEAPYLRAAVARAETRDIGDGMRGWSRKNSDSDISPVTSATLALWCYIRLRRNYDPVRSIG